MKLFFWKKKKDNSLEKTLSEVNHQDSSNKELEQSIKPQGSQSSSSIVNPRDKRYSVLAMKEWSDEKLSPVAWARIILRIFSILRDNGYSFGEIHNPTTSTTVDYNVYLLIKESMKDIYKQDYNKI